MHVWAITGAIACGKSTVARLFAQLGAQVRSADDDARAVLEESAVRDAVRGAFPDAFDDDGALDRAALGRRIFADPEARRTLNALTHPAIRRRMRAAIDAARADTRPGLLLYEVPLLYEGALEGWFDGVIAVAASPDAQAERLQAREAAAGRPPLTADAIAARLSAQISADEKARRADVVVRTDTELEQTRAQVARLWRERFAPR